MSLTVKHCLPGGEQFVYPVHKEGNVNFVPSHAKAEQHRTKGLDSLFIELPQDKDRHHDRMELTGGRAYVMNDHGATVATYWLGEELETAQAA